MVGGGHGRGKRKKNRACEGRPGAPAPPRAKRALATHRQASGGLGARGLYGLKAKRFICMYPSSHVMFTYRMCSVEVWT